MTSPKNPVPRLHLRITPTAEWRLRSGHPWLYSDSVLEQNREGELGELAVIYDRHDNFLGIGLFDPGSPLRVRLLVLGKPQTIDRAWWASRLHAAVQRRGGLFGGPTTGHPFGNSGGGGRAGRGVGCRWGETCFHIY